MINYYTYCFIWFDYKDERQVITFMRQGQYMKQDILNIANEERKERFPFMSEIQVSISEIEYLKTTNKILK